MIIKASIDEVRAVIAAINDIRRFAREKTEKRGRALTGTWTNEGDAIGPLPSHFVDLELVVKGKKVSGIVRSRELERDTVLPNGSIVGEMRLRKIVAEVLDVRRGQLVKYGDVTLERKGDFLIWIAHNRLADFLPDTTKLWKLEADA